MSQPLSRETMIEDLLNDMETWDSTVLAQMAIEYRMDLFRQDTTEDIREQWEETFGHVEP